MEERERQRERMYFFFLIKNWELILRALDAR